MELSTNLRVPSRYPPVELPISIMDGFVKHGIGIGFPGSCSGLVELLVCKSCGSPANQERRTDQRLTGCVWPAIRQRIGMPDSGFVNSLYTVAFLLAPSGMTSVSTVPLAVLHSISAGTWLVS